MEDIGSARQNVLVTGATGFIGSRLVEALCAQGYRVRALVRTTSPLLPEAVEQVKGDPLEPLGILDACRGISDNLNSRPGIIDDIDQDTGVDPFRAYTL